ncbi:cytochrome c [Methylomonas sp. LL1]|uniref:cytochrome c n=1 Tax=Methylomonas sp. LL1 TaxID=2785785 RepID=UPI0018C406AC|nr:cytochrome c [Methylomonas sp. LL1]QPK63834.1 cytochrome c [Methylomonas sp. LL1]
MTLQHLAIFIGSGLLAACAGTPPASSQTGLPDTGTPALHAVSDTRLRELMDSMNSLMFERFMAEPDIDHQRRIYALKIADAADKLGATVDSILSRLPALNLSPEEQTVFRALAVKLREQTESLKAQAERNQIDAIEPALDQVAATCSSCHALFRKLGN